MIWLKVAPWAGCAVLMWLWLGARDDVAAAVGECNADKMAAVAQAESEVRQALEAAHARELAALEQRQQAKDREIQRLNARAEQLAATTASHEATIDRLTEELFDDDLPDSGACLSAFMLRASVDGLLHTESCGEASAGGSGDDEAGADSGGTDAGASAFADITYSDAVKIWQRDRRNLALANCQLRSIRNLSNEAND